MQNIKKNDLTPEEAIIQAMKFIDSGHLPSAEHLCRSILKSAPTFHQAYFQLAVIASKVNKLDTAEKLLLQAINIDNKLAYYHRALGEIYRRMGKFKESIAQTKHAIKITPKDAESFYNLGVALVDSKKYQEAVRAYSKALELNPNHGLAANNLGSALEKLGDEKAAVKAYSRAIAINPKHAEAQNNLGAIFSARGELEKAKEHFNAAIEANNNFVHSHFNLSTLKKYKEGDPHIAALEAINKHSASLPSETRMRFAFAIAKAKEDIKEYDEAFKAYELGNKLKRATFSFDVNRTKEEVNNVIKLFNKPFLKEKTSEGIKGYDNDTPIFIVGMPRSGTTLIEQIISSHNDVFGAGELKDFPEIVSKYTNAPTGSSYMKWLKGADDKTLASIGKSYVKKLRELDSKKPHICDKMPGNFFYVGLIHMALPKAKIIHSMRDPMDTCFSNYSRLFNETMSFAYSLEELGEYYNCYKKTMDHWKKVLPKGTILDVQYEDVVDDLEKQAKRLIKHCGLKWDNSCLDFHNNKRYVKTASVAQVREPIYKSSVARWKNFEKHLNPLKKIIEGEK
ncbi:MAG TPA: hypothetical protein DIV86_06180 [Alphaproteobacteria bacterium]|nr:hypothetical protein [Alphaproteobacteria bacterium]